MLGRTADALRTLVDGVTAALLMVIAVLTLTRVLARYVFSISLPWSEELLRLLFVWLVMMGAARAHHIRIDVVDEMLPSGVLRPLRVFNLCVGLALLGVLLWYGADLVELVKYDRFTALDLSVQWLYRALMVGGAIWAVTMAASLLGALRQLLRLAP